MQEKWMKGNFVFFANNLLICVLAAGLEGFQQLNKVIDSSIWKVEQLTVNQLIFSCFCCCCYVWWLTHPDLYFGTLVFPSILLLAITVLTSFAGLSHVLLYTLILHHLPDVVLSLLRLFAAYKTPNSRESHHSGQILASLAALSSLPIWLLTRFFWFVQLLNPLHLEPLPDGCVATGLIIHVLMWILVVFNALHFWRMLRHFWEYVTGAVEQLVEPFTPPKAAVSKRCHTAADSSDSARRDQTQAKDKTA